MTQAEATAVLTLADYKGHIEPDWCAGCGDFGVLKSLGQAAAELQIQQKDIVIVSGIGCSSNLPGFFNSYAVHSIHGRAVPVATGICLANKDLHVVITGGDGDGYGIGMGHFVHAMRRNLNLTYIVMDNQIYGLTTGQCSPTSAMEMKSKSTPAGNIEEPINPITLALVCGATFISRAYSGAPKQMTDTIAKAIKHKGFSLVDVFSPCVTYNKVNTYPWFRERVYHMDKDGHDKTSFDGAMAKGFEFGDRIPLGIFYQVDKPTYEDRDLALQGEALVKQKVGMTNEQGRELLGEYL
ncbi:MAG: thiamine pyrophosphate-dependent enzyme [Planctomycetota bacterium]|nr:thiamine pyrophosphate-dependent enzyme [Planctomycetota bacterium]